MANTRDLIQNSFNLKLQGPINGSGNAARLYPNLHHYRYMLDSGTGPGAAVLEGNDEERWIIADQEVTKTTGPDGPCYRVRVTSPDLMGRYIYNLYVINA